VRIGPSIGIPGDAAASGGFSPLQLNGVVLFVRGDLGVTLNVGNVSDWGDQSGLGNHLTQGTAGNQPLFVASGLNGKPTVRFDGAGDTLKAAPFTLNQPMTLSLVYKSITVGVSAVNDHITDGNTLDSCGLLSDTASGSETYTFAGGVGNLVSPVLANGVFAYVDGLINGASSSLRSNGVQVAAGNAGANNAAGFALGAGGDGTRSTNIEVAEVIIYNRVLAANELAVLDAYRKARYAL